MASIAEVNDSLPYLENESISPQQRKEIELIISKELPPDYQNTLHPSLQPIPESKFSECIQKELDRHAAKKPLDAIDFSRYEALDPPTISSEDDPAKAREAWKQTLRKTSVSSSYLSSRLASLALLEKYGKNAWLIGNSQLETILRDLESDLAATRESTKEVNKARKAAHEAAGSELSGLEESWRSGISKTIEVEVAAEELRKEMLKQRRQMAH